MSNGEKVYKTSRTILKVIVILGQLLAVGAGALVTATPATWGAFAAAWPALIMAAGIGVWKAVENVRKNLYPDGPAWEWGGLFRRMIGMTPLILLLTLLAGCTTTRWKHVDELGALTQGRQNTFFAKTDASAIQAAYSGEGDKWDLEIGSTADNADSTDALKGIEFLTELVRLLAPIFGQAVSADTKPITPEQPPLTPESLPQPFIVPLK